MGISRAGALQGPRVISRAGALQGPNVREGSMQGKNED